MPLDAQMRKLFFVVFSKKKSDSKHEEAIRQILIEGLDWPGFLPKYPSHKRQRKAQNCLSLIETENTHQLNPGLHSGLSKTTFL